MDFLRNNLLTGLIALAVAGLSYVLLPDKLTAEERNLFTALIAALAVGLLLLGQWLLPKALRWFSIARVRYSAYGLLEWSETKKDETNGDNVWEWFTDQLLVAQRRYAVSVGCLAFEEINEGRLRCLMVERSFAGFGEKVLLWPGGRFRGSVGNLEAELKKRVFKETGCNIEFLPMQGQSFAEQLPTYDPDSESETINNDLFAPPLFVMQQNREQSHGVPGHVDFVFLARVSGSSEIKHPAMWLSMDDIDDGAHPTSRLWPDTRACIKRAGETFTERCSGGVGG